MFFDFIINNILWLSAIIIILTSIWLNFFEIRKLKKYINTNSMQQNNINEKNEIDNTTTKQRKSKNKEQYSEEEIGTVLLDVLIEQKKINTSLKRWRNFGILIIIIIIISIIGNFFET